jgi:hypothetical protein
MTEIRGRHQSTTADAMPKVGHILFFYSEDFHCRDAGSVQPNSKELRLDVLQCRSKKGEWNAQVFCFVVAFQAGRWKM